VVPSPYEPIVLGNFIERLEWALADGACTHLRECLEFAAGLVPGGQYDPARITTLRPDLSLKGAWEQLVKKYNNGKSIERFSAHKGGVYLGYVADARQVFRVMKTSLHWTLDQRVTDRLVAEPFSMHADVFKDDVWVRIRIRTKEMVMENPAITLDAAITRISDEFPKSGVDSYSPATIKKHIHDLISDKPKRGRRPGKSVVKNPPSS